MCLRIIEIWSAFYVMSSRNPADVIDEREPTARLAIEFVLVRRA
jgi:hypothetical protein